MSSLSEPRGFEFAHLMPAFTAGEAQQRKAERRVRRILESIQRDVDAGGTALVRQILAVPQELYRIEVERPDMSYLRTTVLGREALTALLEETPEALLRERFIFRAPAT